MPARAQSRQEFMLAETAGAEDPAAKDGCAPCLPIAIAIVMVTVMVIVLVQVLVIVINSTGDSMV